MQEITTQFKPTESAVKLKIRKSKKKFFCFQFNVQHVRNFSTFPDSCIQTGRTLKYQDEILLNICYYFSPVLSLILFVKKQPN